MEKFDVLQRTSDGMFNATSLLKQWNHANGMKKEIKDYFENKSTKELIEVIIIEENLDMGKSPYVKSRASRGDNAGTWLHPVLFVDFAMWINPRFRYHVLKFVSDQLIEFRHKIGDNHNETMKCLKSLNYDTRDYSHINKAINWIVFNRHHKDIRNTATEKQMEEVNNIQDKIKFSVDMCMVRNKEQLMSLLRKMYNQKYNAPF